MSALLRVALRYEQDVVLARRRARELAAQLGFAQQDQTRLATAVSELARNAVKYAGGGVAEFSLEGGPGGAARQALAVEVRDDGPGIADVEGVLEGRYASRTGMGLGIVGARRLADEFAIETGPGRGTRVRVAKVLPDAAPGIDARDVARIVEAIARAEPESPYEELEQQNRELAAALLELRERQAEVERLNAELAETNRGVLALYAELDERAEYLQRLNELKTRFLSDLSHELRTPLNGVRNLARLLLDGYEGELNEGQRKAISLMRTSADNLAELVDDWLDLAKIDAGKVTVRVGEFDVADVLAGIRGVFRQLPGPEAVTLVVDDGVGLPRMVSDEAKIAQILRNLVSNALKFTERGEVRVTVSVDDSDTVHLTVRDTGIGIAPADHARIFEEFSQVESPVQRRVKGTGLGLPLSRRLARLLGGDIMLESEPGRGSTFTLVLPRVHPSRRSPQDERDSSDASPAVTSEETARE